jgi:hypothetical protein
LSVFEVIVVIVRNVVCRLSPRLVLLSQLDGGVTAPWTLSTAECPRSRSCSPAPAKATSAARKAPSFSPRFVLDPVAVVWHAQSVTQFAAYRLQNGSEAPPSPQRFPLQKTASFSSHAHAPFQPTRPPAPGARAPVTKTVKPPATAVAADEGGIGKYDGGLERDAAARDAKEKSGRASSRMSEESAKTLALDSSTSRCVAAGASKADAQVSAATTQGEADAGVDAQRL